MAALLVCSSCSLAAAGPRSAVVRATPVAATRGAAFPCARPVLTPLGCSSTGPRTALRAAAAEVATAEVSSKPVPSYVSLSENYAVIDVGGTQHLVEEGRWYTCNRLNAEPGSKIQFGRVLAHKSEGAFNVGRPYLENVSVEAEILEELKGPKLIVYKHKPKKHYQRKTGHRQPLTKFLVTKITPAAAAATAEA